MSDNFHSYLQSTSTEKNYLWFIYDSKTPSTSLSCERSLSFSHSLKLLHW